MEDKDVIIRVKIYKCKICSDILVEKNIKRHSSTKKLCTSCLKEAGKEHKILRRNGNDLTFAEHVENKILAEKISRGN